MVKPRTHWSRARNAFSAFAGGLFCLSLAAACALEAEWIPAGEARTLSFNEATSPEYGRTASIVIEVRNTGRALITRSVVCASVTTDRRSYYFMLSSEAALPAGQIAYLSGSLAYDDPTESAAAAGPLIEAAYFD